MGEEVQTSDDDAENKPDIGQGDLLS